jgi:ankyrin repeat protein
MNSLSKSRPNPPRNPKTEEKKKEPPKKLTFEKGDLSVSQSSFCQDYKKEMELWTKHGDERVSFAYSRFKSKIKAEIDLLTSPSSLFQLSTAPKERLDFLKFLNSYVTRQSWCQYINQQHIAFENKTILHLLVEFGNLDLVRDWLQMGAHASIEIEDIRGKTPFTIALESECREISGLLYTEKLKFKHISQKNETSAREEDKKKQMRQPLTPPSETRLNELKRKSSENKQNELPSFFAPPLKRQNLIPEENNKEN